MSIETHFRIRDALEANPLAITKAVDFTDEEISEMWVDWPSEGGFAELMNVRSQTARFILGGKGTGRTHVMRHFSSAVQVIRGGHDTVRQVREEGVLGIYVLCSGLNSSRFRGRGQTEDAWQFVFAQYADVWLAQAALEAFTTVTASCPPTQDAQRNITENIRILLPNAEFSKGYSLTHLRNDLYNLQRKIDLAVNNAAVNKEYRQPFEIHSSPGTLVFGLPEAIKHHYDSFKDVTYLYLIDEFENFDLPQQRYVNTLLREKRRGTSFMIGVRTYGLRTLSTLGGGEENRRGSEFDEIRLDHKFTGNNNNNFADFCRKVVSKRLVEYDLMETMAPERLQHFFEYPSANYEEKLIIEHYDDTKPPYIKRFRDQLNKHGKTLSGLPLDEEAIDYIVDATRVPNNPLLEKVNIFLMYRQWSRHSDLLERAEQLVMDRLLVDENGNTPPNDVQQSILRHYAADMKAQLCNDRQGKQTYAGLEHFITMADGLPRNLLVILKNIYRWALYNGERPFRGQTISLEAQRLGVFEAANWFLTDAKPSGQDGEDVNAAMIRLGSFLRQLRFADKPVECSLSSFSADLTRCTSTTRKIIKLAEQWSLLMPVDLGQKERGSGAFESKYYLNRLLCPLWDLPIARRGAIGFNTDELNVIFDPHETPRYRQVIGLRLARMNVPFNRPRTTDHLPSLFDIDAETKVD